MSKEEVFRVGGKNFTAVAVNCAAKAGEWIKSKLGDIRHIHKKVPHVIWSQRWTRGQRLLSAI